jgi:hypothetical protein
VTPSRAVFLLTLLAAAIVLAAFFFYLCGYTPAH